MDAVHAVIVDWTFPYKAADQELSGDLRFP
jgi:hypothetical protein